VLALIKTGAFSKGINMDHLDTIAVFVAIMKANLVGSARRQG
jgi:hypothetical protein